MIFFHCFPKEKLEDNNNSKAVNEENVNMKTKEEIDADSLDIDITPKNANNSTFSLLLKQTHLENVNI